MELAICFQILGWRTLHPGLESSRHGSPSFPSHNIIESRKPHILQLLKRLHQKKFLELLKWTSLLLHLMWVEFGYSKLLMLEVHWWFTWDWGKAEKEEWWDGSFGCAFLLKRQGLVTSFDRPGCLSLIIWIWKKKKKKWEKGLSSLIFSLFCWCFYWQILFFSWTWFLSSIMTAQFMLCAIWTMRCDVPNKIIDCKIFQLNMSWLDLIYWLRVIDWD